MEGTFANCIEGLLANQKTLFPQDPEIEAKARHYADQIRRQRLSRTQAGIASGEAAATMSRWMLIP
ncbi:MAG: hypothetical protein HS132_07090 [Planctomycetia bacterium]|nr:hypothetical protein [Planctomycetia bacterium]